VAARDPDRTWPLHRRCRDDVSSGLPAQPETPPGRVRLRLLGGFGLIVDDRLVSVPEATRRLVGLLALRGVTPRTTVAAILWPDAEDLAVPSRIRTAVWRANTVVPGLVVPRDGMLALAPWLTTDVDLLLASSSAILREGYRASGAADDQDVADLATKELLPEWSDDWVVEEREYLRQIQLHALEALAGALMAKHRYSAALESAMRAVQIDPLRETAHRAVIEVHLAESNVLEAARHYSRLSGLLERELGVAPSPDLGALLEGATRRPRRRNPRLKHLVSRD
jgi:DNA-binding SARP family transcriptional activator